MAEHDLCMRLQSCIGGMYDGPLPIVERCGKGVRLQGRRSASWGQGTCTRVRLVDVLILNGLGVLTGPGLDHVEIGGAGAIERWPGACGCPGR